MAGCAPVTLATSIATHAFFITDRLKELIKVKGFQVAPAELEALLYTHQSVSDAAVIGRPDERDGETPVAYVVARGGLDPEELKNCVAQRVGEYKQLGDVVLCEAIPESPSGRVSAPRTARTRRSAQIGQYDVIGGPRIARAQVTRAHMRLARPRRRRDSKVQNVLAAIWLAAISRRVFFCIFTVAQTWSTNNTMRN